MNKKIGFLFPGQGAQYPGMGRDFFEQYKEAREVFEEADALLGYPFSKLIFEGPAEELTLTKNSQLAIFITSIAFLRVLQSVCPDFVPSACAGLSLGEYSALVAAEKLTFAEALRLVNARGKYMHNACMTHSGAMQVVLGMELPIVEEALKGLKGVWIANLNCPGQIVISGTVQGITEAAALLKEKGARRVMPLDVSGAFHSGLMQGAQDQLEPLICETLIHPSQTAIVMNVPGDFVAEEEEILKAMIHQVTQPVRWQKGIETLVNTGHNFFIEIGPGKTLAGMNKRIGVSVPTISIEKVEDLQGVGHASVT